MDKKKLPLFAKIFGNKYYIRIVEDMKEDEIVFIAHKLYIPANSILFNKGVRMEKRKLSLFARIFGKKYFIKTTDDLKEDEILIIGRKIYISKKEE